jgi:hypothetical protein
MTYKTMTPASASAMPMNRRRRAVRDADISPVVTVGIAFIFILPPAVALSSSCSMPL